MSRRRLRPYSESAELRALVDAVLGSESIPVRGILFDKIPDANWRVPWHQDVTIAVQEKVDAEGFGPGSIKADVWHVQPPAYGLEKMISLGLHLDKCGEESGALRVLSGSPTHGRIPEDPIAEIRDRTVEHLCKVDMGGVFTDAATAPRRVLSLPGSRASQESSTSTMLVSIYLWACDGTQKETDAW
jgi:hypothetical protein